MIAFGIYLVKVSVCLAVLYALYATSFKNYTFFRFNRAFLLFSIVVAFLVPVIRFSWMDDPGDLLWKGSFVQSFNDAEYDIYRYSQSNKRDFILDYSSVFSIIYFVGVSFALFRVVRSVLTVMRLKRGSKISSEDNVRIVRTDLFHPFSFFNLIFMPKHKVNPLIIRHEKVHINQFHWVDLVLVEMAGVILWFNPLIYLYKRAVQLQHEYLADVATIREGETEEYLQCLLHQAQLGNSFTAVSHFYSNTIKKRIMMISRKRTSIRYSGAYLLLIPAISILLVGFSDRPGSWLKTGIGVDLQDQPSVSPIAPGNGIRLTSGFGKRTNPFTNKKQFHTGIDFQADEGSIVMSTAHGIVVESAFDSIRGNYLSVRHNEEFITVYNHLKNAVVNVGDVLEKGQTIGYVGSTGWSTAPHLHYEVHKDGKPVDPKNYLPQ